MLWFRVPFAEAVIEFHFFFELTLASFTFRLSIPNESVHTKIEALLNSKSI